MGQYYKPVLQDETGKFQVVDNYLDRDDGTSKYFVMMKLLEHSWWYNSWVNTVMHQLYFNPQRLWWVGDYADKDNIVWQKAWQYDDVRKKYVNEYFHIILPESMIIMNDKIVYNHSKKQWLNLPKYAVNSSDKEGRIIHPIPLLTWVSSEIAGGDYRDNMPNFDKLGYWAGDLLSIERVRHYKPEPREEYKDYEEFEIIFKEEQGW